MSQASISAINVRIFNWVEGGRSLVFTIPIWIAFLQDRISVSNIALFVAFGYLTQLLLELPTGALADLIGRKKTIVLAYVVDAVQITLFAYATSMMINHWVEKKFPLWRLPNIRRFYILTALNNTWFLSANWIFYWLRFMNYGQLGVMDAICFLFGLIMEVPSGAVADAIGKRKTIIGGTLFAAIGFLLMGTATGIGFLWIGFLMAQAGWALYSGAAEALAYDSLVDINQEQDFDRVISTSGSIATITAVIGTLVGGVMYSLHWRSTHLAMAVSYFLATIVAYGLLKPRDATEKFRLGVWWSNLVLGTRQLFVPSIRPFLVVILLLIGTVYMYDWSFIKPAMAIGFGFFDKEQAVLFAIFGIINAVLIKNIPKLRNWLGDKIGLYYLTIIMGAGFLLATLPLGFFGLIPMLIIIISGYLAYPWVSIIVNKEIDPKYRATTLSTVTLLTKIPYVLVAVVAGVMIEGGQLWLFNLLLGSFIVIMTLMAILVYKPR